jgi:hypothetical protein
MVLWLLIASAPAAAQSPAADPWSRVPALPASCDVNDGIGARLASAIAAVDADLERQERLNAEVRARFEATDTATRRRNLQAFLQKNPQQPLTGLRVTGSVSEPAAPRGNLNRDDEFRQLTNSFNITVAGAADPVDFRIEQLVRTKSQRAGESLFSFAAAADEARYLALQEQRRTDYENICRGWFGPNGEFRRWLSAHRTYLIDIVIPPLEATDRAMAEQLAILLDSPTLSYRSTATLRAIRNYLLKAAVAYGQRKPTPVIPESFVKLNRRPRRDGSLPLCE